MERFIDNYKKEAINIQGSRFLLECLKKEGVDTVFGYPGGAVIPLFDSLYDFEGIKLIRPCHEQCASHAADGYSRASGKIGVCIGTSGPGATNLITGIATAYMDSIPMIIITGQVGNNFLGKDSFQELDITGLTMPITKHNYLVTDANDIANVVSEAFFIANDKRKGPVLIDITKSAFLQEVDKNIIYQKTMPKKDTRAINYKENIKLAVDTIKKSSNVVIYAGGGIIRANASENLRKLYKNHNIPVLNSSMSLGSIDRTDKLSYGIVGMHGEPEANDLCYNADVVLALGVRFSDRAIGNRNGFTKNSKIIHVDTDESEINKNIDVFTSIIGDIRDIIDEIDEKLSNYKLEIISRKEKIYPKKHPKKIFEAIQKVYDKDTIIVTDVGQHQMWTAKYYMFKEPNTFITSGGLGTMGFGVGASIGAKVSMPQRDVLLITGDGSFRMNQFELLTASSYNINFTVIIFNNSTLGMVRQWQNLFSNKRYSHTDIDDNLNIQYLAKAYNANYYSADTPEKLEDILSTIDTKNSVNIINYILDKDEFVYPIVPAGDNICNYLQKEYEI